MLLSLPITQTSPFGPTAMSLAAPGSKLKETSSRPVALAGLRVTRGFENAAAFVAATAGAAEVTRATMTAAAPASPVRRRQETIGEVWDMLLSPFLMECGG